MLYCLLPHVKAEAGRPCGISPHSLFALKLACLILWIPNKVVGIFPVSLLMERSSHSSFTSCPKLVGMVPVIWFLEISSLSSSMRFEIELGTWPAILLLPIFSTFKLKPSVNSGIVPEMRLLETSITSKKLLVLLFKMLERDPNT
ncbi:hypothetical protein QQP08_007103 [Theobroma cacao]|nr:hypothetical protein QQP08_007103 [Theobroma cacao]